MKLTKKDFILLANVLNHSFKHGTDFVSDLADVLESSNPRFNREKWVDAVFDGVIAATTRITPSHTEERGWEHFKEGDKVLVMREPTEKEIKESTWQNCWASGMDKSIGKTLRVYGTDEAGVLLADDFAYPWWVLEHV